MVMPTLTQQQVDEFWSKGYLVIPGVYTPEEIEGYRQACHDSHGYGGDLLANPRLRSVITDGRMISVSRQLLGVDDIVYTGDSSYTINGTQRGWHKDNTDRRDPDAPDWQGRYTQLRFGIYCQDHAKHTGGLNLREGSHEHCDWESGEARYVKTRPGDLAVWSMRITHSGNGMLLKRPWHNQVPLPLRQHEVPEWKVAKAKVDRIAIFAHLGADDALAQRYADYLKTRTYMVNIWRARGYDDDAIQAAKEAGLVLRDMPAEVADDPTAGLKAEWEPFPY